MKVITYEGGIAALQFVTDEVRPPNGYYLPAVLESIAKRYEIAKSPTVQEAVAGGARFQIGRLTSRNIEISIVELGIYNDAVSVTTQNTADSEVVLHDVVHFLIKHHSFREPITKPLPAFQSDVIVEFENDPEDAFEDLEPLRKFLQDQRKKLHHPFKPVQFNRFAFGADPLLPGPNADFLIERRAKVLWDTKRYFSKAHLPTDAHIKALEMFDKLLGKRR
jgi:hypothetical protein